MTYIFCFCIAGIALGRVEVDPGLGDRQGRLHSGGVRARGGRPHRGDAGPYGGCSGPPQVLRQEGRYGCGAKSHLPEADLDPVGEGITLDCTDDEWMTCFESAKPWLTAS
jgi:hypothetical protein